MLCSLHGETGTRGGEEEGDGGDETHKVLLIACNSARGQVVTAGKSELKCDFL